MPAPLVRHQRASIEALTGVPTPTLVFGTGWDGLPPPGFLARMFGAKPLDIDAVALAFDEAGQMYDQAFPMFRTPEGASMQHTGDDRLGAGAGDDERIYLKLAEMPDRVRTVVPCVTIKSKHRFGRLPRGYCRLFHDGHEDTALTEYRLPDAGLTNALVFAMIARNEEGWWLAATHSSGNAETVDDLITLIQRSERSLASAPT